MTSCTGTRRMIAADYNVNVLSVCYSDNFQGHGCPDGFDSTFIGCGSDCADSLADAADQAFSMYDMPGELHEQFESDTALACLSHPLLVRGDDRWMYTAIDIRRDHAAETEAHGRKLTTHAYLMALAGLTYGVGYRSTMGTIADWFEENFYDAGLVAAIREHGHLALEDIVKAFEKSNPDLVLKSDTHGKTATSETVETTAASTTIAPR